jgi:hypothetical protein
VVGKSFGVFFERFIDRCKVVFGRHSAFDIAISSATAAKPCSTVERIMSSDAFRFFVGFFAAVWKTLYHTA